MDKSKKLSNPGKKEYVSKKDACTVTESDSNLAKASMKRDFLITNKSCYVSPEYRDFGQLAEINSPKDKHLQSLLMQQFGFGISYSETNVNMENSEKARKETNNMDKTCQYLNTDLNITCNTDAAYVETPDGTRWQDVEDTEDIRKYFNEESQEPQLCPSLTHNMYISEVPQIKVIAEKFTKYKKNNVELRKLEEKIVCVEYDIFDNNSLEEVPVQKMRAFFSIKPVVTADGVVMKSDSAIIKNVPSIIKNKFRITDEDLRKLDEKEIEIIDGKLSENRPYLEGLKKILKRKQAIYDKKNKSSLDLMSLYRMAKRDNSLYNDYSETDFLSKAELEEVKDLILQKCASSVHGISRTKVRKDTNEIKKKVQIADVSQSIFNALLREIKSQL